MRRRSFLAASLAAGVAPRLPGLFVRTGMPVADDRRKLADLVLDAARRAGASYTDVRICRERTEATGLRDRAIDNVSSVETYGCGIRVLVDGAWGFSATNDVTPDGLARCAREAVAVARANRALQSEPVILAPEPGHGEVTWRTPGVRPMREIAFSEKRDLLLAASAAAFEGGARFFRAGLFAVNHEKYIATSDGTYADQDIHRIWPNFTVTAVDPKGGFATRDALSSPMGMGWEYVAGAGKDRVAGPVMPLWFATYDIVEDARLAAQQAKEKLAAKSVTAGTYDLVLDPTHLFLTIHESVGHPLELDRVLGYEANYAGTSFATLDKWRTKSFPYGSKAVTFFADRTTRGSLGECGWDDEGVTCQRWDLVKDGVLVDYQYTRDQAHIVGGARGQGCAYAQSWRDVPFQRMPNVSLAPGAGSMTPAELIAGVDRGIYILGRGSYSIDQQRYNFQFGGQLFYEIRGGKITGMLRDVAYQANTQEFWNAMRATCGPQDWRLNGSFSDGKGQPSQVSAVSHGAATSRFDGVKVLNTGRRLG